MTLGKASQQGDLFDPVTRFCDDTLGERSIYGFLHRGLPVLFPDVMFADLFVGTGRRSVPPSVVAAVMVLQRLEGLSDREAAERFTFDARWRYAAGVGGWDGNGRVSFAHTVLVDMRERLRRSADPDRVFMVALAAAGQAGLVGRRRVLDSTPLCDAVATMDTVTLIRSAIRGLLTAADADLEADLRALLSSSDDYRGPAKPGIDWDDRAAQAELIDSRACDGHVLLARLDGRQVSDTVAEAARLLATILGQDLEEDDGDASDGHHRFRIARRVAPDRIISTVDPQARHGHKTNHRGYDGFKGHIAIDPDSEIITATAVSAPGISDALTAVDLLADILTDHPQQHRAVADRPAIYGDAAYGTGELLTHLDQAAADAKVKVQKPVAPDGHFTKDAFTIDLTAAAVTCPAGITKPIRPIRGHDRHAGAARYGKAYTNCPLAARCTTSKSGRIITIGRYEARLITARAAQTDPVWKADYRATRPKVERKIGHLMRRRHGGRRTRMRGIIKVAADFTLLAAATNLARLATLGLTHQPGHGWATA